MNQITIPLNKHQTAPANEINRLADQLLSDFKVSGKRISPKNWNLLSEILNFVAEAEQTIAAQNERIEKLEVLSTTDPLTGLLNRRGMMQELDHAIALANRHGDSAILAYIDLDGFKQVNDTYGHGVGDALLTHFANSLKASIRQTDFAARFGGDEFALLLNHLELEGGRNRTHFIQQQMNFTKFKCDTVTLPILASFGLAEITPGKSLEDIIQAADQDMYRNKTLRKSN
ncbi:GGDEF domain-containing protein [Paremcibacter congregatus]|uniref:GGDEF domain-containing protein n=1 Tax=Paremcibacter congregatus TaxID=2043170 RepID=UPI0030EE39E5|tara:strand:- start:17930 stop:18619 length:690 start_codon:yes stop_codon:yes gene_type:complete